MCDIILSEHNSLENDRIRVDCLFEMLAALHTLAVQVMLSCDIMTALGGPVVPAPHIHAHREGLLLGNLNTFSHTHTYTKTK